MRTKRTLGLVFVGLIAATLTGCSKHAQLFWSGAAIGAVAGSALTSSSRDCDHHHHRHHHRGHYYYVDDCGYRH